mmetsp:Transcript_11430/g.36323  ORF Transcript_11430/g.36323 Transcript_11430/m.36323 type:complete len:209 (+) Transcript_11430:377-1003(+)
MFVSRMPSFPLLRVKLSDSPPPTIQNGGVVPTLLASPVSFLRRLCRRCRLPPTTAVVRRGRSACRHACSLRTLASRPPSFPSRLAGLSTSLQSPTPNGGNADIRVRWALSRRPFWKSCPSRRASRRLQLTRTRPTAPPRQRTVRVVPVVPACSLTLPSLARPNCPFPPGRLSTSLKSRMRSGGRLRTTELSASSPLHSSRRCRAGRTR